MLITKLYIANTVNNRFAANAAFGRDHICPMHGKAIRYQVSAVMSITAQIFEDHITGTADLRLALNCCSRTAICKLGHFHILCAVYDQVTFHNVGCIRFQINGNILPVP